VEVDLEGAGDDGIDGDDVDEVIWSADGDDMLTLAFGGVIAFFFPR